MQDRQDLRREILLHRLNEDFTNYKEQNIIIAEKTLALINLINKNFSKLGIYKSLKGEPDLLPLFVKLFPAKLALPYIIGDEMIFTEYGPCDKLVKGPFKDFYQSDSIKVSTPSIILVPGVAFNCKGFRLGFGFGYYDKYLSKINSVRKTSTDKENNATKIITIGVCFHKYLVADFSVHDKDYKLDFIITDKVLLRI